MPPHFDMKEVCHLLLEELGDHAIFIIGVDGKLATWNAGVERVLQYTEEEFVGQPLTILFTPEDIANKVPEEETRTAAQNGRAPDIRWHVRKGGSRIFVDGVMVALKSQTGELIAFAKVMRDVTERVHADEALRASEARFRAIVNATSQVIYCMSPDWTEMRQLGGGGFISDTESPSTNWLTEYIHSDDQPEVLEAIQKAIRAKTVFEVEHRVRRVDGTLGWVHSRAAPLFDGNGEICEWFGAASDITARKVMEQERERLVMDLARSNDDLSQFARVASHDLKAPLNNIVQFSQLLLKRYKTAVLDETAEEFLDLIVSSAQRMIRLTSDLLRYAGLSSTPLLPAKPIRAKSMVEGALANLQGEIESTSAVVTCGTLPEVNLEGALLLQLFQNLIGNAIKYSKRDAPRTYIGAEEDGDYYQFSVRDNGIGIEAHHQDRIFEPFKRLHGTDIPGNGIGLAVCKRVVERAGGRIWVESALGEGSTFYFKLPRHEVPKES